MTTSDRTPDRGRGPERVPSVAEVAALTCRLRELSTAGPGAEPAARVAFLADKQALLARIDPALTNPSVTDHAPAAGYRAAEHQAADYWADGAADEDGTAAGAGWSR